MYHLLSKEEFNVSTTHNIFILLQVIRCNKHTCEIVLLQNQCFHTFSRLSLNRSFLPVSFNSSQSSLVSWLTWPIFMPDTRSTEKCNTQTLSNLLSLSLISIQCLHLVLTYNKTAFYHKFILTVQIKNRTGKSNIDHLFWIFGVLGATFQLQSILLH